MALTWRAVLDGLGKVARRSTMRSRDLAVVVIAVALGAGVAGGGDAGAGGFVGEVEAALRGRYALVDAGEEDGFFVFLKRSMWPWERSARRKPPQPAISKLLWTNSSWLEWVMKLRLIFDFQMASRYSSRKSSPWAAVDGGGGFGAEGGFPDQAAGDGDREAELLVEAGEEGGAVVIGGADEGDAAVAVGVGPAWGWGEVDLVGS